MYLLKSSKNFDKTAITPVCRTRSPTGWPRCYQHGLSHVSCDNLEALDKWSEDGRRVSRLLVALKGRTLDAVVWQLPLAVIQWAYPYSSREWSTDLHMGSLTQPYKKR